MRKQLPLLAAFCSVLLLPSCEALTGKEIGRLSVAGVSTDSNFVVGETSVPLHKNEEVALWSHMDMEYDGEIDLLFRVRLVRDSMIVQELEMDPREKNITVGEVQSTFGGHTKWSFTGKNATVTIPADGTYNFQAILVASNPDALKLTTAELVLKQ